MPGQLIVAPQYVNVEGPVLFLAGPIQGSKDWQRSAIEKIRNSDKNVHIANPRRDYAPGEFEYTKQVDWERYYLKRAFQNGAIMVWLAKEYKHRRDRAYAQTTRFELGELLGKGAKAVVGIEEGFTGAKYVRHVLPTEYPKVPICKSLEETCKKALELLSKD